MPCRAMHFFALDHRALVCATVRLSSMPCIRNPLIYESVAALLCCALHCATLHCPTIHCAALVSMVIMMPIFTLLCLALPCLALLCSAMRCFALRSQSSDYCRRYFSLLYRLLRCHTLRRATVPYATVQCSSLRTNHSLQQFPPVHVSRIRRQLLDRLRRRYLHYRSRNRHTSRVRPAVFIGVQPLRIGSLQHL